MTSNVAVFKRGDKVRILKGTPITGTFSEGKKVAGRDYVVTVHRISPAYRESAVAVVNDRYVRERAMALGIDVAALERLQQDDYRTFCNMMVEMMPEKVVWAGTGGYWHEAPLSEVAKV